MNTAASAQWVVIGVLIVLNIVADTRGHIALSGGIDAVAIAIAAYFIVRSLRMRPGDAGGGGSHGELQPEPTGDGSQRSAVVASRMGRRLSPLRPTGEDGPDES